MSTFASLIPADAVTPSPRALAVVMLDRAGVDPDAVKAGVTVIACSNSVVEDVTRAIDHFALGGEGDDISAWSAPAAEPKFFLLSGKVDDDQWKRSLALGKPVIVVATASQLPTDSDIHATRRYTVTSDLTDSVIASVVKLVTGDEVDCSGLAVRLSAKTILSAIRPGDAGQAAVDRMRAIVQRMIADAAKKQAERDAAEADQEREFAAIAVTPDAAKAVVTKLSDLSGYGEAKTWGLQLAADLADYRAGRLDWQDVDRGILLTGAPGTGKTYFARALAAECDVPLIPMAYSDLEGGSTYVVKEIKKKFDAARKKTPCIVFIDEIDSFGSRGNNSNNESYWAAIINALLSELDGATPRDGIVAIGATNNPGRVDRALLRAGRLGDRIVEIPMPGVSEIGGVIRHHITGLPLDSGALLKAAMACRGQSPAAIAQLCRYARRAARKDGRQVTARDVQNAAWDALPPRDDAVDRTVSIHEAAHAVAAVVLGLDLKSAQMDDPPHCAIGFSTVAATRDYIEAHVVMTLAARRADAMIGDGVTAAADSDLAAATAMARNLVARWGMGASVYAYGDTEAALDREVKNDVRDILETMDLRAAKLVDSNRDDILRVAEALRRRRYLDLDEVLAAKAPPTTTLS